MKINIEELSSLERRMNVEIPSETVSAAFDQMYKNIQRDATLKGFRKGKAPISTIKSLYKDRVRDDVVNNLVQKHYTLALDEKSLNPINYPNIKVSEIEEDKAFSFTAEFEIQPEVKLSNYEGLQADLEKYEFDTKHLDSVLENIRKNHATRESILEDRPAKDGDIAVIDFDGSRSGVSVANTQSNDFELEIGSNSFIPGFEAGIAGMRIGDERNIDLTFPTEYHAKELAGTPITFKVKLKALKKSVLPTVDDELAKRVGAESLEKLKTEIESDHKKSEEKRISDDFKNRLLKALIAKNPIAAPKSLVIDQKQVLVKDVQSRLKSQGMGDDEYNEYLKKWDADFDKTATYMVQSGFLINALAAKENLNATDTDVETELERYAKETGIEIAKLKGFYKKNDQHSRLQYRLTEDKVVEFLKSRAKIREVAKKDLKD